MEILIAVLVLGGLVVVNGLLYKANKETPTPEGCAELTESLGEACHECNNFLCGHNENKKEK